MSKHPPPENPSEPAWYVYLLECADGSLYTGIARNLMQRLAKHNAGLGAKYTRGRRPVSLIWSEPVSSRSHALEREYLIKQLKRQDKLKLIRPRTAGGL
jgi:putative endonuclease